MGEIKEYHTSVEGMAIGLRPGVEFPELWKDYLLLSRVAEDVKPFLKDSFRLNEEGQIVAKGTGLITGNKGRSERDVFDGMNKFQEFPWQYYIVSMCKNRSYIVDGKEFELPFKVGDRVLISEPAGVPMAWNGEIYLLIRSSMIIGKIK